MKVLECPMLKKEWPKILKDTCKNVVVNYKKTHH